MNVKFKNPQLFHLLSIDQLAVYNIQPPLLLDLNVLSH